MTDAGGAFALPGLPPGTYEATLDPPDGFAAVPAAPRQVVVPPGGGPIDLDFTVRRVAAATPTPTPTPTPSSSPTTGTTSGTGGSGSTTSTSSTTLPEVGGPSLAAFRGGLAGVGVGTLLLLVSRRRRTSS